MRKLVLPVGFHCNRCWMFMLWKTRCGRLLRTFQVHPCPWTDLLFASLEWVCCMAVMAVISPALIDCSGMKCAMVQITPPTTHHHHRRRDWVFNCRFWTLLRKTTMCWLSTSTTFSLPYRTYSCHLPVPHHQCISL